MKKRLRLVVAFGMASCAAMALFPLPAEKAREPSFIVEYPPRARGGSRPDALFAVFAALAGGTAVAAGMGMVIRAKETELRRQRRVLAEKQGEIDRLAEINRQQERELAARKLVAPAAKAVFRNNFLN